MKEFDHNSWADLYRAAMLEADSSKLPVLVEAAIQAIQAKLAESQDGDATFSHRRALEDALQNLRVLQREYS
jgi:hypothetical protein